MDIDQTRISRNERDQALTMLSQHFEAGRLHSFEYEDRRGRAADATVRSELDALFTDLPSLDAAHVLFEGDGRPNAHLSSSAPAQEHSRYGHLGRCLSAGTYSWLPLLATALFLLTRQWVWFLMIPAAGLIMNSGSRCRPSHNTHPAPQTHETHGARS